ncbi:TIM-barrel domain-containing protein [Synechococcus sp. O70.1]|uniref:TIM-barrel domain-containing protein n=1 Tax=Synechococcus sp. O70.1 TaxID=2964535 RepID=UPI0039C445C8
MPLETSQSSSEECMHNLYGLLRAHASRKGLQQLDSDQCSFVLTRSGFARIWRWVAVWTGDNQAG